MLRPVKITCIVLAALYITYHLVTLSYSPLPQNEETHFARIALSLSNHIVSTSSGASEVKIQEKPFEFAPVYFILTGLSFKLFGFGIFQFRVVNLLFGFLLIWTFSKTLKLYHSSTTTIIIINGAFLLDPFLQLSLHEARMDLVSLALMLSSALVLLKSFENENLRRSDIILSGILAAIALLVTPRIAFIYLTLGVIFIVWIIKNCSSANLLKAGLWILPVIIIYTSWLFYYFGGIQKMFSYYTQVPKDSASTYFGFFKPVFFIPKQEWLLIICAILSLLYKLVIEEIKLNYFYLFSLLSIVVFYIIVIDSGPYSVLIIPFYYFIIADSLKNLSLKDAKNPFLYIGLILFMFNLSCFSINGIREMATIGQRDYKKTDAFIKNFIPPGSKVVGDPLYFYSIKKASSDLQIFKKYGQNEQKEGIDPEQFNYEYLIVTDHLRQSDPEAVVHYLSQAKFKKVARFEIKNSGYNADLYVILKFEQPLPTALINN